jgi:hypothetical protein
MGKIRLLILLLTVTGYVNLGAAEFNCLPSELRQVDGEAVLFVDGEPVMPMSFCSRNNQDDHYLKLLFDAGIKVHFPICDTDWRDPEGFAKFSVLAHRILAQDPQAILVPRLSLDPPDEWMKAHPEECITFENGTPYMIINTKIGRTYSPVITDNLKHSLASTAWREKATEAMEDFIRKVAASDFGNRVAGYFFTAAETEEWYYTVTYDRRYHAHDFSKPMVDYFRNFVRGKYKTDEALAAAWNNDVRSFGQVRVPQLDERTLYAGVGEILLARFDSRSTFGTLANPDYSEFESDYYRAVASSVADAIIGFAGRAKEISGGRLITGAFYGAMTCVVYHEMGVSGAVQKIQDAGVLDFFSSPATYFNRAWGGQATSRSPFTSYSMRGMQWLTEEDTRTHLCDFGNWVRYSQADNPQQSVEMIKRDMAKTLTQHNWAWWFENSRTDRWYDCPEIAAAFTRIQELFRKSFEFRSRRSDHKPLAEIALVAGEESIFYTDHETLRDQLMWQRELEFERLGAPYDYYYIRDLADPRMPDYKLYVFVNPLAITSTQRAAIKAKLAKNGATALWCYAPGLIDTEASPKLGLEHMKELTGFDFAFRRGSFRERLMIAEPGKPLVDGLARDAYYGQPDQPMFGSFETRDRADIRRLTWSLTDPLFYLPDSSQAAGAVYDSTHLAAAGDVRHDGFRSIWLGTKYINAELVKNAARLAGAHVYCATSDVFYADRDFATLSATYSGVKTLRFPVKVDLYEVFENKYYGRGITEISFPLELGQTKVFCLRGKI